MTAHALQSLAAPRNRSALVDVNEAAWLLRARRCEVIAAVECGSLLWSFDVGLPGTGRRVLRIALATPGSELADLIGPRGQNPTVNELARRWGCSAQHLLNLCNAGCLAVEQAGRKGAGQATVICRWSAAEFLLARRIGEKLAWARVAQGKRQKAALGEGKRQKGKGKSSEFRIQNSEFRREVRA